MFLLRGGFERGFDAFPGFAGKLDGRIDERFIFGGGLDRSADSLDLRDVAAAGFAGEKVELYGDFFTNGERAFAGFGDERRDDFAGGKSSRQS